MHNISDAQNEEPTALSLDNGTTIFEPTANPSFNNSGGYYAHQYLGSYADLESGMSTLPPEPTYMNVVTDHAHAIGERPSNTILAMLRSRYEGEAAMSGSGSYSGSGSRNGSAAGGDSGGEEDSGSVGSGSHAESGTSATSISSSSGAGRDHPHETGRGLLAEPYRFSPSPPPEHLKPKPHIETSPMFPVTSSDFTTATCLLPELRVLRLNIGWGPDVRAMVAYRTALANGRKYQHRLENPDRAWDNDGRFDTEFAFDTLGLIHAPVDMQASPYMLGEADEDMDSDATWLKVRVQQVETNLAGWHRLDDGVIEAFS